MDRISPFFSRNSRGWVAILATVVFLLFMVLVLPGQASQAEDAGGGSGSPDTSFWYSAEDLYRFADAYGEAGRAAYVRARWTFDLIFPLVYAFFLITSVSWIFAYATPQGSSWRLANLFPLAGMLFDYLENCATSLVMVRYPQLTPLAVSAAPILTLIKWFFVMGSFVLLLLGVILAVGSRIKRLR